MDLLIFMAVFATIILFGTFAIILMASAKSPDGWRHEVSISIWVIAPFLSVASAFLFFHVSRGNLITFFIWFFVSGFGITVGYHRLLTHQAFKCRRWVLATLIIMGETAIQGEPIFWAGKHLEHHSDTDGDTDPHSPHAYGTGFTNVARGLAHAHMGWMYHNSPPNPKLVGRMNSDSLLTWLNQRWWWFVVARFAITFLIGTAIAGPAVGLGSVIWCGVAAFMTLHLTFAVNSVCHMWGKQPYMNKGTGMSKNNLIIGLLALGEGMHNNHHAFPSSALQGLNNNFEKALDLSWWFIRVLIFLRLAWSPRIPTQDDILKRRAQSQLAMEKARVVI